MGSDLNFEIVKLGECRVPSPLSGGQFVRDDESILVHSSLHEINTFLKEEKDPPTMDRAGPSTRSPGQNGPQIIEIICGYGGGDQDTG